MVSCDGLIIRIWKKLQATGNGSFGQITLTADEARTNEKEQRNDSETNERASEQLTNSRRTLPPGRPPNSCADPFLCHDAIVTAAGNCRDTIGMYVCLISNHEFATFPGVIPMRTKQMRAAAC